MASGNINSSKEAVDSSPAGILAGTELAGGELGAGELTGTGGDLAGAELAVGEPSTAELVEQTTVPARRHHPSCS